MNKQDQCLWEYYQNDNSGVFSGTHDRHKKVAKEVKKIIPAHSKVLEIGFGDGYLLKKLSRDYDCSGADISLDLVEKMRQKIPAIKFSLIANSILPYQEKQFDCFIASEVMEHMSNEELSICIREIKRILKHDGYAVITVPAEENLKENECFCPYCNKRFHKWGHKQSWNIKKIKQVFSDFDSISVKDYFVRYEGNDFLEWFIGYLFYFTRNILNKIKKMPNRSYLIILKK